MNGRWTNLLPYAFMLVAALSRWPGLFPPNFSAFYALAFCAGAFFPRGVKWWLPMGTLLATDLVLNLFYYHVSVLQPYQLINYAAFAGLILLGTRFGRRCSFLKLLSGGLLGAILFYLVTNIAAWLFNPYGNPEYTKDLAGLIIALTQGTAGHPPTFEFFRHTLMSGGLFTSLFAGAMKLSDAAESAREKKTEEESEEEPEAEPAQEEGKA